MAKRDYIKEIEEIRTRRLKRGSRWEQLNRRFHPLLDTISHMKEIKNQDVERETIRYVFICLVACLEGYFRLVISDLVDNNPECRDNIAELGDLRFDIQSVLAIHGKTVSMGEFVAHLVPLSSLELLNKNLSVICSVDYLDELKKMEMESDEGEVRKIFSDTLKYVKKTYELRNIYCHELAPKKEPTKSLKRTAMICALAVHDLFFANEVFVKRFFS